MIQETKSVSHVILRDTVLEKIKHAELYSTFRKIINDAIENCFNARWIGFSYKHFFSSVMLLFDNKTVENSGVDEIQIFLAGNSSKSPILQKLFTQYIQQENDKINGGKSGNTHFHLFPPLGTAEAIELQKQKGLPINTDITAPTGKTG